MRRTRNKGPSEQGGHPEIGFLHGPFFVSGFFLLKIEFTTLPGIIRDEKEERRVQQVHVLRQFLFFAGFAEG